jgi:hypothetical protein
MHSANIVYAVLSGTSVKETPAAFADYGKYHYHSEHCSSTDHWPNSLFGKLTLIVTHVKDIATANRHLKFNNRIVVHTKWGGFVRGWVGVFGGGGDGGGGGGLCVGQMWTACQFWRKALGTLQMVNKYINFIWFQSTFLIYSVSINLLPIMKSDFRGILYVVTQLGSLKIYWPDEWDSRL